MWWLLATLCLADPASDPPEGVPADAEPVRDGFGTKPEGELPRFRDLEPRISCCLSRELVQAPLRDATDAFRDCWDAQPARRRAEATRTVLRIVVDGESGAVRDVRGDGDHPVLGCLVEVVETLQWSPGGCGSELVVHYPLVLLPAPDLTPARSRRGS